MKRKPKLDGFIPFLEAVRAGKVKKFPKRPKGIRTKGCIAWGTTPESREWLKKYSGGFVISKEAMEYLIAEDSPLLKG